MSPRVLISDSHDAPAHKARVLALANRLRADGVDARLDQYVPGAPEQGWPGWMHDELEAADVVLLLCTETDARRILGREPRGRGLGARWEGLIVTQLLYEAQGRNQRFIPAVFTPPDLGFVPVFLRGTTQYVVDDDAGYDALRDRLLGRHVTPMPPLGTPPHVPEPASVPLATPVATATRAGGSPDRWAERTPVLLRAHGGSLHLFAATRIRVADAIDVELVALTTEGAEVLASLQGQVGRSGFGSTTSLAIAYGSPPLLEASWVTVRQVRREMSSTTARWHVVFERVAHTGAGIGEMTVNGHSPDEIAALRARRILLDERPRAPGPSQTTGLDRGQVDGARARLLESAIAGGRPVDSVRGAESVWPVDSSPLRGLAASWSGEARDFVIAGRLVLGMWLLLTDTVERIRRLEVRGERGTVLQVDFVGVRRQRFVNQPPAVIAVQGDLPGPA